MKRSASPLLLLALTVAVLANTAAQAQARFVQDRFAIGLWVDPPLDDQAEARYQDLADANFTMVIGGFSGGELLSRLRSARNTI